MKLTPELERINLSILNGALDLAESDLNRLTANTVAEKRTKAHFQGIVIFHRGEIGRAKQQMESALQQYGENVNLLRDLIACQYHLQDMDGFRTNLKRLETLLTEKQDQLSQRSLLECELMVGKFLEEEARLAPSYEFYERALKRAQSYPHRLRALIQKARWVALYEPADLLSELYRELISAGRERLTHDLHIELEHSLMLIELRLVGPDHAWGRVTRMLENMSAVDQRLFCFDFIEGVLAQDMELSPAVLKTMNSFSNLDPYEGFIVKSAKGSLEGAQKLQELSVLATRVPWNSYLRLLCLASNRESSPSIRQELNRKIQLIIRGLDPRSQQLWSQRLKEAMQTPEIRVEYSQRDRVVTVQGREVDLSKKKIGLQLLDTLAVKPELSVDEAISLLWQSEFSPEHYHRLRMSVHRLNTLINKATGLGKIIEVDAQTVRLRPEVRIRAADAGFELGQIRI